MVTITYDFITKLINLKNGNEIKLKILDTPGIERLRSMAKNLSEGAHYIVFGYDINDRISFKNIRNWLELTSFNIIDNSRLGYLIGYKIDQYEDREVSEDEGRVLANELNLHFFEISSKDDIGIEEFYDDLINEILNNF